MAAWPLQAGCSLGALEKPFEKFVQFWDDFLVISLTQDDPGRRMPRRGWELMMINKLEAIVAPTGQSAISIGRAVPTNAWYLPVKYGVEWLSALGLLVITSPLALILALLVKLTSRGPIFYTQSRLGHNGRQFRMIKFRSMAQDAERHTGPVWAAKQDSRITPIGAILRSTHLDELPQLFNVLRGEMSLIGPRPERPELAARISRYVPDFPQRLAVRPGITGLAQMLLPADDPQDAEMQCVRRKLAHDLSYVRQVGPLMDIRIALGTPCYFLAALISVLQRKLVQCYEISGAADPNSDARWKHNGSEDNCLVSAMENDGPQVELHRAGQV